METERAERRLSAIMAADVAGYSRLMGEDEEGTLARLNAHRRALVDPKIAEHGGRIVKTTGDGILVEFASVVRALCCAVEIQRGMAERDSAVEAPQRIRFRIGINVGDVIIEDGDIFGDGVNVAARLEGCAEPGGICVSRRVQEDAEGKLDIAFEDLGEQKLKNIARPVHAFRVRLDGDAAARKPSWPLRWAALIVAALIAAAAVSWFALVGDDPRVTRRPAPSPPVSHGAIPTVAVLPFANLTGDDAQDYLADGITEEVIDSLGRFNTLRVIGRNAVFRFKNRVPTEEEVSSELGASYIVTGSLRRSDKRVRISAQLAEAQAGTVTWTERYEGELTDVFDFQDTIARRIAGTLAANIAQVEGRRRLENPRPDPTAFDLVLRARAIGHARSRTANRQFRELITKAIELDPNYAAAHAHLAEALSSQAILGWTEFPDRELSRAADEAQKAVALAPDKPEGYRALGRIHVNRGEYDRAQTALKRAVEINPSDSEALATWGAVQAFSGDVAGAVEALQLALKLDPMLEANHVFDLAASLYLARNHEEALRAAQRGLTLFPNFVMLHVPAAAAAARLGRTEEAADHIEALRQRAPFFDPDVFGSRYRNPSHAEYLREGLQLAGF